MLCRSETAPRDEGRTATMAAAFVYACVQATREHISKLNCPADVAVTLLSAPMRIENHNWWQTCRAGGSKLCALESFRAASLQCATYCKSYEIFAHTGFVSRWCNLKVITPIEKRTRELTLTFKLFTSTKHHVVH